MSDRPSVKCRMCSAQVYGPETYWHFSGCPLTKMGAQKFWENAVKPRDSQERPE